VNAGGRPGGTVVAVTARTVSLASIVEHLHQTGAPATSSADVVFWYDGPSVDEIAKHTGWTYSRLEATSIGGGTATLTSPHQPDIRLCRRFTSPAAALALLRSPFPADNPRQLNLTHSCLGALAATPAEQVAVTLLLDQPVPSTQTDLRHISDLHDRLHLLGGPTTLLEAGTLAVRADGDGR
jgi:hypothetical protein